MEGVVLEGGWWWLMLALVELVEIEIEWNNEIKAEAFLLLVTVAF